MNREHVELPVENHASNGATQPLVSVVSLAYNRRDNVLELMAALRGQDYTNYEVILVDNASGDGTADAVAAAYPEVQVVRCPKNHGMVAYNLGLEEARGDYIVVMDDDGLPASRDWLSQVVARFEANPQLGVVACTIRMRDTGRVGYDNPQYDPEGDRSEGFKAAAYNGTGAGLRAAALHQVGTYPFHFFRTFLELHLCTRLIDAGWQVRYFPDLEVWHCRASGSTNRPVTYFGLRNYFWYVWTLYPWPQVFKETLRYLGYCLKLVLRRELSLGLLVKAWTEACTGWLRLWSHRRPVSGETLAYLHHIRRNGSRSAGVPEFRPFATGEYPCC